MHTFAIAFCWFVKVDSQYDARSAFHSITSRSISHRCILSQVIFDPTHYSHAVVPSTIDLAFIPSQFFLLCLLWITVQLFSLSPSILHSTAIRYRVSLYYKADTKQINDHFSSILWDSLLSFYIDSSSSTSNLFFFKL